LAEPHRAAVGGCPITPTAIARGRPQIQSGQLGDNLADRTGRKKLTRWATVPRVAGSMVVDAHPSLWEHIDALDGVDRRARRHIGRRAAVRRRWRDALSSVVERVYNALPTLVQKGLNCFHFGVRRPENPNPISHLYSPYSSSLGFSQSRLFENARGLLVRLPRSAAKVDEIGVSHLVFGLIEGLVSLQVWLEPRAQHAQRTQRTQCTPESTRAHEVDSPHPPF